MKPIYKCECCSRVVDDPEGLTEVFLGDDANTIEQWCGICYEFAFPNQYQRVLQTLLVSEAKAGE